MAKSLEGYWEGEGPDPGEAINDIVRKMERALGYPADLRYVDTSDYEFYRRDGTVITEESVKRRGEGDFHFTICLRGHGCYSVNGTVFKKGKKWIASGEAEVPEYA
jgi:hypothetical protein